jgi:hypothetical protein
MRMNPMATTMTMEIRILEEAWRLAGGSSTPSCDAV